MSKPFDFAFGSCNRLHERLWKGPMQSLESRRDVTVLALRLADPRRKVLRIIPAVRKLAEVRPSSFQQMLRLVRNIHEGKSLQIALSRVESAISGTLPFKELSCSDLNTLPFKEPL